MKQSERLDKKLSQHAKPKELEQIRATGLAAIFMLELMRKSLESNTSPKTILNQLRGTINLKRFKRSNAPANELDAALRRLCLADYEKRRTEAFLLANMMTLIDSLDQTDMEKAIDEFYNAIS